MQHILKAMSKNQVSFGSLWLAHEQ